MRRGIQQRLGLILVGMLAVGWVAGCGGRKSSHTSQDSNVITMDINGIKVKLEVARGEEELRAGLMDRDTLAPDAGMLFVFQEEGIYPFWMKNTRIPLSIAFIRADGVIVGIERMQPLDTLARYMPFLPFTYAIEMNAGWFKTHGVQVGDTVLIPQEP